jgi:hypothetical protein
MILPGSEHYDENGNVTHFGMIDPISGGPALVPNVGGNYDALKGAMPVELQNAPSAGFGGPPPAPSVDPGPAPSISGAAPPPSAQAAPIVTAKPAALKDERDRPASKLENQSGTPTPQYVVAAPAQLPDLVSSSGGNVAKSGILDPKREAAYSKAVDAVIDSKHQVANAEATEASVRAARAAAESNTLQDQAKQRQDEIDAENKQLLDKHQEISDLTDKFSNSKLDMNNYWNNKGTGEKVLSLVALSVGAFGQAFSGSGAQNQVTQQIQKEIDQDVDAQKFNIDKQGKVLAAKRGLYQDMRQQFQDENAAKDATRAAYYNAVGKQYDSIAASQESPLIQARATDAANQFRAQAAQATMDATKTESQKSSAWSKQPMGKMGYAQLSPSERQDMTQLQRTSDTLDQADQAIKALGGSGGKGSQEWQALQSKVGFSQDPKYVAAQTALDGLSNELIQVEKRRGNAAASEATFKGLRLGHDSGNTPADIINRIQTYKAKIQKYQQDYASGLRAAHPFATNLPEAEQKIPESDKP